MLVRFSVYSLEVKDMENSTHNVAESRPVEVCPQCHGNVDATRPRLVVDSCGHKKCRLCLILDELGCSLCNDARKATAYNDYMGSPVKLKSKSLTAVSAMPVVNEDPCNETAADSFMLGSVIKFSELDDDSADDNEHKSTLPGKTGRQLVKFAVDCSSGLNLVSNVGQKQVSLLQIKAVAVSELHNGVNKDSDSVCKTSGQTKQVAANCNGVSSQKHEKSHDDQCEDYFAGIETNPEYGATDTLDAVLLTQDSPIVNKDHSRDKLSNKSQPKKKEPQADNNKHIEVLPGPPVKYFCTICRKTMSTKRQRKYHSFCGGDKAKPYHCMLCGKAFVSKSHYEYHIRTHAGVRPFSCDICSKSFYEKVKKIRHMMSHTGERPFVCKECDKTFVEECQLRYHLNTHSKEKLYLCSQCGRQFSLVLNLKRHELMHEVRQVMCELCGKIFSNNWALTKHKKIHSRVRLHKCPVCSRTFTYRKDMKRHHNIHTSTRSYKCSTCEVVFTRKDGLVRHIKSIHQDGGRNKKSGETITAGNSEVVNRLDNAADEVSEELHKKGENGDARVNVAVPQRRPKSLEDLLSSVSCVLECDNESSTEVKLPKCGRIKGSKNRTTTDERKDEEKNNAEEKNNGEEKKKLKSSRSKDSHPIFRQIIYSNFQVNGNFKQIPVLLTQDKTVRCKEVSVINRPVGNVEVPTVKNPAVQPAHSSSSPCIIHHTSTLSTVASATSARPSTVGRIPGVTASSIPHPSAPLPRPRPSCDGSATKPATATQRAKREPAPKVENCVRTITRVPEGLLKPLVPASQGASPAATSPRGAVVSCSNVIQSCGQPSVLKVVHDVHWKKRSVEIELMKQKQ